MATWLRASPASVTTAATMPNSGVHGGEVMVVTRMSPGSSRSASTRSWTTRAGPRATPGDPAAPRSTPSRVGTVSGPVLPMTTGGVTVIHRSLSTRRAATASPSLPPARRTRRGQEEDVVDLVDHALFDEETTPCSNRRRSAPEATSCQRARRFPNRHERFETGEAPFEPGPLVAVVESVADVRRQPSPSVSRLRSHRIEVTVGVAAEQPKLGVEQLGALERCRMVDRPRGRP